MQAETKMFDIFVVRLYLLLPQFGHVVIAKQRAVCCASRSPILSSHNNGATLFLVGVNNSIPRICQGCSKCAHCVPCSRSRTRRGEAMFGICLGCCA